MWQPTETLETNGAIQMSLSRCLSFRFLSLVVIQAQMDSADLCIMSLYNYHYLSFGCC